MTSYLVPAAYGEAELIEKRSRFIGHVWRVESEAEAVSRIDEMRKKHYDATHNVYAYILRENGVMRYSDDGEPGGTSGQPTLNVFRSSEIQNVCCVVTRYFGGTLLGSGGLVRAYSTVARMALDAAGTSLMAPWSEVSVYCAYGLFERVKRLLECEGAVIDGTNFGSAVTVRAMIRQENTENFQIKLTELSSGTAVCKILGERFMGVKQVL